MKRIISLLLAAIFILAGCIKNPIPENTTDDSKDTTASVQLTDDLVNLEMPEYKSFGDEAFLKYFENRLYKDMVSSINSDEYFIENVQAIYYSQEYIDEFLFNSQSNLFFGFTLAELEEAFEGQKYVFTLGEDGKTTVKAFEAYDDTYEKVIRNVAIGGGVILVCVAISVATSGAGAPAAAAIFAASAKTATVTALSSGVIGGIASGVVTGVKTKDFDAALKSAALAGSEGFKWGAISGAIAGGAGKAVQLKGMTCNGLTMNEAAIIQKESGYPVDVIKQFRNIDQYNICKNSGLKPSLIDGKTALIRNINLDYIDQNTGLTNLQLMQQGKAAIDPVSGLPYELHHIGQKVDSTLAILTKAEHMQNGNNTIWHLFGNASEAHAVGNTWDAQRISFWKNLAKLLAVS